MDLLTAAGNRPANRRTPGLRVSLALGLAALWSGPSLGAAPAPYNEDAVKAAFIYRFMEYVGWPGDDGPPAEITIGVLGAPAVATELMNLAQKSAASPRLNVVRLDSIARIDGARVLFVGGGYRGSLRGLTRSLGEKPVLVVSDAASGLDDGGMINFIEVDRRVRFEISTANARRAGLKLSSELLAVAVRVKGAFHPSERPWDPFNSVPRLAMIAPHRSALP